ncbi:hypothetical protein PHMEG_00032266 [Phytophthora megakarya]|uniref:Uncharacterized protein n=1 Tax=Phytophthora megakarya TaxID=4795 RepID=A0A225UVZ9_9STRA|nr:hypothetical protein PHMEG_00032266 [Phytophthora megakarya]
MLQRYVKLCALVRLVKAGEDYDPPSSDHKYRKCKEREYDYAAQIITQGGSNMRASGDVVNSNLVLPVPPTSNACE